jgi:transposase
METLFARCAGLDVHSKTVVACRRILGPDGKLDKEVRSFGTTTSQLEALAKWLQEGGVTHVAMESTGVFWKPIWNVLEARFEVLLVNARNIKKVPGRKTDVRDCEWIAQLLQCGLLSASFVPPPAIRELRELTRHRAKLIDQRTAVANRVHKTLEDANIKLGTVASDILGVSGRDMLRAIVEGETDSEKLASLARQRLRIKIPALREALHGRVTEHHRFLLGSLLEQVTFLEKQIAQLDERIADKTRPFESSMAGLDSIPGVAVRGAASILAEIGPDMAVFPSAAHLASWAAICPGNDESAGKRKSGATAKGNRWLRRALVEAAWAAVRTRNTYLAAQYRRIAARRGKRRAIVAVAHTILVAAYHILSRQCRYQDLGADYFLRLDPQRLTRSLVRRLEKLGHKVTLEQMAA